jgi:polysaccharide export outer membrane protein
MSVQEKPAGQNGIFTLRSVRRSAVACVLIMSLGLSGCTGAGANLPPIPDTDTSVYHLGPGDQIRIITFGDQELSGQFRLDPSGTITVPLLGNMHVAGMTAHGLEGTVGDRLKEMNLFKKPSVSVEIMNYRPIFVLGEVARPGEYPYQPGMTMLTAVAVAGGFTYRAVKDKFSVVRAIEGHKTEGVAQRQTSVQPGDVVSVYERTF